MAKPLNLIGQRFGNLEVLDRAENNKRGNTQWLCKCDCGKISVVDGYGLAHGRNTTCGCAMNKKGLPSKKRQDLTGKRYNKLTVIGLSEKRGKRGSLYWDCKCDCGNEVTVSRSNLVSNHVRSCGCLLNDIREKKKIEREEIKEEINEKKNLAKRRIKHKGYLTGMRFGRLVVTGFYRRNGYYDEWYCRCDCGKDVTAVGQRLKNGAKKSCGCMKTDYLRTVCGNRATHNHSKTRMYALYRTMIRRCTPNYHGHKYYYDKGITVCDEWKHFEPFEKWAIENGYAYNLSIDRIDNSKGYSPQNCRWVDMKTQENNKTNNVFITRDGQTKTMKQWSEEFGIPYGTVKARRRKGWSEERLFEPVHKNQYQ